MSFKAILTDIEGTKSSISFVKDVLFPYARRALPVLPNSQDMPTLAAQVDALLDERCMWGYLIDGHGLYAWGADMAMARRHLDAFEFLLACDLETRKLHR